MITSESLYEQLLQALRIQAEKQGFLEKEITIRCRPLTPEEAIGAPEDRDYPIIKGKEAMVEANFQGACGQAFSDTYGNSTLRIKTLLEQLPDTNRKRAEFIAALNAVYRHLGLCDGTVHCKDEEPLECARDLAGRIGAGMKVLLIGLQPRILERIAEQNPVRVIDLDPDNIGTEKAGVVVEGPEMTEPGIEWCHTFLVTGSTLVNGTLPTFLRRGKPVIFFGVTIAAAAVILKLDRYCYCGH